MKTKIPEAFINLPIWFEFDTLGDFENLENFVRASVRHLRPKEKRIIRNYLTELLASHPSDKELKDIWDSTSTDYYISGPNGVRHFFEVIRDHIEDE